MIFIHVLKLISLTYKTTLLCVCSISHRIYSVIVAHKIITNYTDEGGGLYFTFYTPATRTTPGVTLSYIEFQGVKGLFFVACVSF